MNPAWGSSAGKLADTEGKLLSVNNGSYVRLQDKESLHKVRLVIFKGNVGSRKRNEVI